MKTLPWSYDSRTFAHPVKLLIFLAFSSSRLLTTFFPHILHPIPPRKAKPRQPASKPAAGAPLSVQHHNPPTAPKSKTNSTITASSAQLSGLASSGWALRCVEYKYPSATCALVRQSGVAVVAPCTVYTHAGTSLVCQARLYSQWISRGRRPMKKEDDGW